MVHKPATGCIFPGKKGGKRATCCPPGRAPCLPAPDKQESTTQQGAAQTPRWGAKESRYGGRLLCRIKCWEAPLAALSLLFLWLWVRRLPSRAVIYWEARSSPCRPSPAPGCSAAPGPSSRGRPSRGSRAPADDGSGNEHESRAPGEAAFPEASAVGPPGPTACHGASLSLLPPASGLRCPVCTKGGRGHGDTKHCPVGGALWKFRRTPRPARCCRKEDRSSPRPPADHQGRGHGQGPHALYTRPFSNPKTFQPP